MDFRTDKRYKDIHDNNTVYCKQTNEHYCRVDLDRPAQKFLIKTCTDTRTKLLILTTRQTDRISLGRDNSDLATRDYYT